MDKNSKENYEEPDLEENSKKISTVNNYSQKNHTQAIIDNTSINYQFKKAQKYIMELYIKFYCNQKGGPNFERKYMIEARNSWHSLTKAEKMQLFNKYKECEIKHKEKIVECIDKAEPYMKKIDKRSTELTEDQIAAEAAVSTQHEVQDGTQMNEMEDTESATKHNNSPNSFNSQEYLDNTKTEIESFIADKWTPSRDLREEVIALPLIEPKPPKLKSGKELYETVKLTTGNTDERTWKSLSPIEKSRYNRAVLLMKKNYLNDYKLFLSSLSPRDLFDYYHKSM